MSYREFHFLEPTPSLVVGLDVGRAYSGYCAWVRSADSGERGPTGTFCLPSEGKFRHDKVPSCLLLTKSKEQVAFGNKAKRMHAQMAQEEKARHLFVENLKDFPYNNQQFCCRSSSIIASQDKHINAFEVIKAVLMNLKSNALETVKHKFPAIADTDSQLWVVSLPLNTSDAVKYAVVEAAVQIGIFRDGLRLVSHEQACLAYCQHVLQLSSPRALLGRAVVVDAGGVDTHISVVDSREGLQLQHIETVSLRNIGTESINNEIYSLIDSLFLGKIRNILEESNPLALYKILKGIEKVTTKLDGSSRRVYIGIYLENEVLEVMNGKQIFLECINKDVTYKRNILYDDKQQILYLHRQLVESRYQPTLSKILETLHVMMNKHNTHDMKVFIVGGYMGPHSIRSVLRADLHHVDAFIPDRPWMFAAQGAAVIGYQGLGVQERITRFSYGIPFATPYHEKHPKERRKFYDGEEWCENSFLKLIERGHVVRVGDTFVLKVFSTAIDPELHHSDICTPLVLSRMRNPLYCTKEQGCSMLGRVTWRPPPGGWPKLWRGEIELHVRQYDFVFTIRNTTTGSEQRAILNFA